MGNYGSTLLGKGDKHNDTRALQKSRLALYQQLLERAKSRAEARSSLLAETDEYEPESKLRIIKEVECEPESVDPADYDFQFENLVLEGGGAKGIAYCGAIKVINTEFSRFFAVLSVNHCCLPHCISPLNAVR